jgi:hypothetical protein
LSLASPFATGFFIVLYSAGTVQGFGCALAESDKSDKLAISTTEPVRNDFKFFIVKILNYSL